MAQAPTAEAMSREGKDPTSGGPPYEVYEVIPIKAFGLPTDGETMTPTRRPWAEHQAK